MMPVLRCCEQPFYTVKNFAELSSFMNLTIDAVTSRYLLHDRHCFDSQTRFARPLPRISCKIFRVSRGEVFDSLHVYILHEACMAASFASVPTIQLKWIIVSVCEAGKSGDSEYSGHNGNSNGSKIQMAISAGPKAGSCAYIVAHLPAEFSAWKYLAKSVLFVVTRPAGKNMFKRTLQMQYTQSGCYEVIHYGLKVRTCLFGIGRRIYPLSKPQVCPHNPSYHPTIYEWQGCCKGKGVHTLQAVPSLTPQWWTYLRM
jgi:hypothetical protein